MPRVRGILETALYVNEMDRATEFYQRVLGFGVLDSSERLTALRVATDQVLLVIKKGSSVRPTEKPFGTIPPTDGDGQLHLAFGVAKSELQDWENTLRANGIEVESKLEWPEGGYSLYFRDPDGHILELKTSDWGGAELA